MEKRLLLLYYKKYVLILLFYYVEYYCPYKKCNKTRPSCKEIIKHIQKNHDSSIELPKKGTWLQYYGYVNGGRWINFDGN